MKVKKMATEILMIIFCGVILWYLYESIVFSNEIISGISEVLYRIINVVFPSLFGFMVVSDFIVRTNLYQKLSVIFYPVSRFVFRMPSQLFLVFLLSCIGGYPVGLKLLCQLAENGSIDKITAEKMSVFCYMPSPSFVVGIIGLAVYSSVKIGMVIYVSCLISSIITALAVSWRGKFEYNSTDNGIIISTQKIVESVNSSGRSMLKMCGVIIFFSYVMIVLDCHNFFDIIKSEKASALFKTVFEITTFSNLSADYKLIPVITSITSFGGICILLQIMSINNNSLSLKKFFVARIPIAFLSGAVSYVILRVFPLYHECVSGVYFQKSDSKFNFFSLICLFFMIIIIFFQKKNCNSQKSVL